MDQRHVVSTTLAPTPRFGYSQGVISNGHLFVAGQVGIDPETREPAADFTAKVHRALQNVAAIAQAAGTSLANAVRVGVFLEDLDRIVDLDPIYREYFPEPRPARTTVQAGLRGHEIEVDAVLAVPENPTGPQ
jgi:2-iminobutanoate/2-iminopropanoate deaminase